MMGTRALALFLVLVCAASAEVQAAGTCPACESTLPASRLARAFGMAEEIHRGVTRKGTGVPYLTHVMSVSSMAMEEGGSEDEGIAGFFCMHHNDCALSLPAAQDCCTTR